MGNLISKREEMGEEKEGVTWKERENQRCPIDAQLCVADLLLMIFTAGHIVVTSLNLFFWNIPSTSPMTSLESQCHPLPGLINRLINRLIRVKELSGKLGEVKGKAGEK